MNCNEACDFLVSVQEDRTAAMSRDFDAHVRSCLSCAKMAAISEVRRELVGTSTDKIVTVPPFFSARVMAAIAEQKAEAETRAFEPWAWIWKMARLAVPAMLGLVVLAAALTFNSGAVALDPEVSPAPSYISQINGALVPPDAPQSIIYTYSGDLTADRVLSTVMGGQVNND